MASIDKIYAESYKEYMDFVNWAKDKSIDFYYPGKSLKVHVMNYVYYPYWDEEDFETSERPITNTPEFIDKYLYKHCPCKFVLDRLNDVYGDAEETLSDPIKDKLPEDWKKNRKIKIVKNNNTPWKLFNFTCNKWIVDSSSFEMSYSIEEKIWLDKNVFDFPGNFSFMGVTSIKALIRRLRKMYLPSGIEFNLIGGFANEEFTIKIK